MAKDLARFGVGARRRRLCCPPLPSFYSLLSDASVLFRTYDGPLPRVRRSFRSSQQQKTRTNKQHVTYTGPWPLAPGPREYGIFQVRNHSTRIDVEFDGTRALRPLVSVLQPQPVERTTTTIDDEEEEKKIPLLSVSLLCRPFSVVLHTAPLNFWRF